MKKKLLSVLLAVALFYSCDHVLSDSVASGEAVSGDSRGTAIQVPYGSVIFYEHIDYGGKSYSVPLKHLDNIVNIADLFSDGNNKFSSAKFVGVYVKLYDGTYGRGRYTYPLSGNVPDFRKISFNDLATSLKISMRSSADDCVAYLYTGENYTGQVFQVKNLSYYHLLSGYQNNSISSAKVYGTGIITLYDGAGKTGDFVQLFSGDYPNLDNLQFDNRTSCISFDPPTRPYVVLFDGSNYDGDYRVINYDITNLSTIGFNDRLSSVQVFNSDRVIFHKHNYVSSNSSYSRGITGNAVFGAYGLDNEITMVDIQ